jgi:hypothetical protein
MSTRVKNYLILFLALTTVVLGALAWRQFRRLQELTLQTSRSAEERQDLQRRVSDTGQRLAAAEKTRAAVESELKELREGPPAQSARSERGRPRTFTAGTMADNPAMQKIMASSMKGMLDQRYAGLFRRLKLSPADLDRFKDLLVEKQASVLDVIRTAQSQGLNLAESAGDLRGVTEKIQAQVDDNIRALLGNEGFRQYQEFNQNIASYSLLDQIERRLSYTGTPLQPAQYDQLLRVLTTSSLSTSREGGTAAFVSGGPGSVFFAAGHPGTAGMQSSITDTPIGSAQTVLTSAQLEVLTQLKLEQENQANLFQSLRAGTGAASGGGEPPPGSPPPGLPLPSPGP